MSDASSPPPADVEALRAANARLEAELAAEREARRVLELRLAELERRLGMHSLLTELRQGTRRPPVSCWERGVP